jgi:DNA-binding MarR family transcriptional regulator
MAASESNASAEKVKKTRDAGEHKPKTPRPLEIEDFVEMVANTSLFLSRLAAMPIFKDANLGLSEWAALGTLIKSESAPLNNKQLAGGLGVTGQRANQIADALKAAKLVTSNPSAEDGRMSEIRITSAGKAQFETVKQQLLLLLKEEKNIGPGVLRINRTFKLLGRRVRSAKATDSPKKKKSAASGSAATSSS